VPTGGTTNQVLTKNSATNYDTGWVTPAGAAFTTGDVKLTYKTVADAGWLMMNDGTIGSAASGATTASATTQNLFNLFFANCTDADVPLQTSSGAATTRAAQGTAAAAWAANCRIVLPKALGRAMAGAGAGSGLTSRALGANAGAETHAQTIPEMIAHTHSTLGVAAVSGFASGTALNVNAATVTGSTGGSGAMSILGPMAFLNVMVCL
jgi:hypothetical protein